MSKLNVPRRILSGFVALSLALVFPIPVVSGSSATATSIENQIASLDQAISQGPGLKKNLQTIQSGIAADQSLLSSIEKQQQNAETPSQIQADINNVSQDISAESSDLQNIRNQLQQLQGVQSQISGLQSGISGLQGQYQSLTNQEDQLENETAAAIQKANDEISKLDADIATLTQGIQAAQQSGQTSLALQLMTAEANDISAELGLKQSVKNLQDDEANALQGITKKQNDLSSEISGDQLSLNSLENQYPSLSSDISGLQTQEQDVNGVLSSLESRLNSLKNELDQNAKASSKESALQNDISNLESEEQDTESQLSTIAQDEIQKAQLEKELATINQDGQTQTNNQPVPNPPKNPTTGTTNPQPKSNPSPNSVKPDNQPPAKIQNPGPNAGSTSQGGGTQNNVQQPPPPKANPSTAADNPSPNVSVTFSTSSPSMSVSENDSTEATAISASPIIVNGQPYVPVGSLSKALGAAVAWTQSTKRVDIITGDSTISFWIGGNTALVNGTGVTIDKSNLSVTPILESPGYAMVPAGFIAGALGGSAAFSPDVQEVTINAPKSIDNTVFRLLTEDGNGATADAAKYFQMYGTAKGEVFVKAVNDIDAYLKQNGGKFDTGNVTHEWETHQDEFEAHSINSPDELAAREAEVTQEGLAGDSQVEIRYYLYNDNPLEPRFGFYDTQNNMFVPVRGGTDGAGGPLGSYATSFYPRAGARYVEGQGKPTPGVDNSGSGWNLTVVETTPDSVSPPPAEAQPSSDAVQPDEIPGMPMPEVGPEPDVVPDILP